jgi:hypothetical protein
MSEGQRKDGVVESGWLPPGVYGMTGKAGLGKTGGYMVWICGRNIILLMTGIAIG